jgi:ankyrin repeat protein
MRVYFIYFFIASISFLNAGVNEDLLQGATEGNTALVKRSIEQRAELESKNEEGETALILAAWYGSPEIVCLLLENGANVNAQDNNGFTAIAKASSLGVGRHYEIVEILIQASANVNIKTKDGKSPFLLAVLNGHMELSNVLKKAGAKEEPYFIGKQADMELLSATSIGDLQRVKYVFFFKPNVNSIDNLGLTPLMHSARIGNREILTILLKAGANVDAKDNSGKTALMLAARRGHKEAITVLLDYDADVDIEDNYKFTAITWASRFGQKEVADFLKRLSDK